MILNPRERKRRMLLRLKGIESGRALIGPATVHLRITDVCNLACSFCWYFAPGSALHPEGKHHLPFEVFESLARDCIDLQVDTINLSGIGDPILHPRFYDMLRLLEPSIAATIFTNGTFPIERCRDILRADRIIINLGAADRKSYRQLHGRDFFMKVIRNIRELARLKPQFNPNFSIEVVIIVTNLNAEHVERTEKLVRKLGADLVQKKEFQPSEHNREIMMPDQEEKTELEGAWPPCYHGWFYSAVKLNGDVNVCCFMDRLTVGNVCTTSFKDIWESQAYSRARASALKGDDPFRNDRECVNCRVAWRNKEIAQQMDSYKTLDEKVHRVTAGK